MTGPLLTYGLSCLLAIVAGALAGGLVAWRLRSTDPVTGAVSDEPDRDPFVDAEIDLASVRWAEATNHPPEVAGLMAERLRTLHAIGRRKGWL